ncbi:hypothetical protein GCM10023192_87480 [Amycolatopsis samaneae]
MDCRADARPDTPPPSLGERPRDNPTAGHRRNPATRFVRGAVKDPSPALNAGKGSFTARRRGERATRRRSGCLERSVRDAGEASCRECRIGDVQRRECRIRDIV